MRANAGTSAGGPFRRATRVVSAAALPLLLVLTIFPLAPALADSLTLYLDSDGVPKASLVAEAPSGPLPNHDPGRDSDRGLLLQKTDKGASETDPTKYQMWVAEDLPLHLDGPVTFTFWSAMKGFEEEEFGKVNLYLMECSATGADCRLIASKSKKDASWTNGESWEAKTVSFGTLSYPLSEGRALAVKITVDADSSDDMLFAYDAGEYPSHLTISLAPPPTTTTTTKPPPPTTTTKPPPPTTTTTTAPPPTTTTTTAPPPSTTTTSTTTTAAPPPATTTTLPPTETPESTTTTTTTPPPRTGQPTADDPRPPVTTLPDEPPEVRLPDADPPVSNQGDDLAAFAADHSGNGKGGGRGMSGALFDGLETVIPPMVAVALLSPLMLVEALFGAFVETGSDLMLPTTLLLLIALWMGRDRRRRRREAAEGGSQ